MTVPRSVRETILAALRQARGDDLERAERAFRGMTPAQMAQQHGFSGQTRQQVLDGYRERRREFDDAEEWMQEQDSGS